jgi:transposase-like protein
MPAPKPPEFRRRAVELARRRDKPVAGIARDLGISESCLRRWMDRSDVDEGPKEGLSCLRMRRNCVSSSPPEESWPGVVRR